MSWDLEVDVLVVGAGGAGLAAAIAAAEEGATVAVAEKSERPGGNTTLSTGSVPGAGTRFQKAAGIDDSPQRFYDDLMRRTENTAPAHLVRALAEESAPLVEWLVDAVGAPLSLEPMLKKVGHSVPRTHVPPDRDGQFLFDAMEKRARALGVELSVGTPVTGLVVEDGAVKGARIAAGNGKEDRVGAGKVILAANGFGANRDMLRRFAPDIAEAPYFGHQGNTGDGIQWGEALGAELHNMMAYQGHASVAYPHGTLVSWSVQELGGFLVNLRGQRFVDETLGYSGCAAEVLAQPEQAAFAVFDKRIRDYMLKVPEFAELDKMGGVKSAPDIEGLAREAGLDPVELRRTFDTYQAARDTGRDPFGRNTWRPAPLAAPFHLVRVCAGLFHTQGGLMVDALARVLKPGGAPIPNLYAAGGTAVGVSGRDGGRGYCSASGLLAALGLGRIAGRHAGRTLKGKT